MLSLTQSWKKNLVEKEISAKWLVNIMKLFCEISYLVIYEQLFQLTGIVYNEKYRN